MTNPEVRPAATLILLRELSPGALEVFMVVRHHQIDVASGALVFPGGKVEEQDYQLAKEYKDKCAIPAELLPFAIAVLRESFEETGVLFAKAHDSQDLITADRLEGLEHYRQKLVDESISFADCLKLENLTLELNRLSPFAHWITPEMASKRFDTHFFVALAPSDQVALHDGEESIDSIWVSPGLLLEQADQGQWKLVFPTRMNVEKLARFDNFNEITAYLEQNPPVTVQPVFIQDDKGKFLTIPQKADYPQWKVSIDKVMNP